jgi:chromosome partitioning protein
MTKIISFGALKGGVGKTQLAFNIAGILSENGNKVLLIDNDLQGNLSNNCSVDRLKHDNSLDIAYDINQNASINKLKCTPIPQLPNLDVIPSSIRLHYVELGMSSVSGKEYILKNFLDSNKKTLKNYDYVIIDTNPSMSVINQNAFVVSHSICLVSDMDINALEGVVLFEGLWHKVRKALKKTDNVKCLILNNVAKKESTITADCSDFFEANQDIKLLLMDTIIPRSVHMKKTSISNKPINLIDKKCDVYLKLCNLINEMRERGIL